MKYRIESDSMGEINVPQDKLWGAQTERSRQNFKIGTDRMPLEVVYAQAAVKAASAKASFNLGNLSKDKHDAILKAAEEIRSGKWDDHFPLVVFQTGSGTQTNMNVNEVIANRGNQLLTEQGSKERLHPNDDVNKSQSSNDTFPTALHIAGVLAVEQQLYPAMDALKATLEKKSDEFMSIVKIGRTHLQDATPLSLGQEFSGWVRMLEKSKYMIEATLPFMRELAIGGTAVGTGINAPKGFGDHVAKEVTELVGSEFTSAQNKFHALTSYDDVVAVHGTIKALSADLMKIANDVRLLASGPRSGIGELIIPANEPGSSIMPGKVNPTQSEALTMVVAQVMGNDTTISFAASQGNYQLNVFKPVIIFNFLQSVRLLSDAMNSFNEHCAVGIEPNHDMISRHVENSLMLVTALNPHIGYENAAKIAKYAHENGTTLKEAALHLELLTEPQFDEYVQPHKMI